MDPSSLLDAFCLTFIIKTFIGSRLITIIHKSKQDNNNRALIEACIYH